jgi:hypothetical protein
MWFRGRTCYISGLDITKAKREGNDVRVTSVTVGDEFKKKRTLLVINSPFPGIFDCLPSGDYVHSVDLGNFRRLEFVCRVINR